MMINTTKRTNITRTGKPLFRASFAVLASTLLIVGSLFSLFSAAPQIASAISVANIIPNSGSIDGGETVIIAGTDLFPKYIQNGLQLYLDAINNTGTGDANHDNNATIWKDLSGNNNDCTVMSGAIWSANYIATTGTANSYIKCGILNFDNPTQEMVFLYPETPAVQTPHYFGNWEGGGYGFLLHTDDNIYWNAFINGAYRYTGAGLTGSSDYDTIHSLSAKYDGSQASVFTDGTVQQQFPIVGTIGLPNAGLGNLSFVIGGNIGYNNTSVANLAAAQFYGARLYDRALTDDEIVHNQSLDNIRFKGSTDPADYANVMTVTVGGLPCTITGITDTAITCTTPAHAPGVVDVVIDNGVDPPITVVNGYTYTDDIEPTDPTEPVTPPNPTEPVTPPSPTTPIVPDAPNTGRLW
jgi:hypothetical protein